MALAPIPVVHNCVAESSILVDHMNPPMANGMSPDKETGFGGKYREQGALLVSNICTRKRLCIRVQYRESICGHRLVCCTKYQQILLAVVVLYLAGQRIFRHRPCAEHHVDFDADRWTYQETKV